MTENETQVRCATPKIEKIALGSRIGLGGMGEVYEGSDLGFTPPRRVAVKVMSPSLSADPEFRARFEREAAIVSSFRHDNIVHVYSAGDADGAEYIVMEFLAGGTLADRLRHGKLPQQEALQIAERMADALAYSHAQCIIHRDFKPANVLFTVEGKPVLSDFGVAKSTSIGEAALTQYASVIGAPRYMAPEQERCEEVTDKVDVFSFALTLFEMLTGRLPPTALRIGPSASDLGTQLPDVPPEIVALLASALAPNPKHRPAARAIQETLATTGVKTLMRVQVRPKARTARWAATLAWAAVLLAALLYILVRYTADNTEPSRPVTSAAMPHHEVGGVAVDLVRLALVRFPPATRIRVDGALVPGSSIELAPGHDYELVAVANGYYGQVKNLRLTSGPQRPLEFRLLSVVRPSGAAFSRFLDVEEELSKLESAAGTTALSAAQSARLPQIAAEVTSLSDPTLQTVLRLELLKLQNQLIDAERLEHEMHTLALAGDARAASAVALVAATTAGRFTRDIVSPELTAASEARDPLADFLLALALRDGLVSASNGINPRSRGFRQYCNQLEVAVTHGWEGVPSQYEQECRN